MNNLTIYKIVNVFGESLLRVHGDGDGPLWGNHPLVPMIFNSEFEAWRHLDRFLTRKYARVVKA